MSEEQINRSVSHMLARAEQDFLEGARGIIETADRILAILGWAHDRRTCG